MNKRNKIILVCLGALLIAAGVGAYVWSNRSPYSAQTTSKSPTAQPGYTDGDDRNPDNGGNASQGGAVDTGGRDVPEAGTSTGTTAESGLVTVLEPAKATLLKNGAVISGTAKGDVTKVQYRLIDNEAGVLAQGSLNVVDGGYSGMLQFSPRSAAGRLDVYSYNAAGTEVNNVEVPVTLK